MPRKKTNFSLANSPEVDNAALPQKLTVLPLRDVVIYPNMIFPILIGRPSSLKAVSDAMDRDKFIMVAAQKDAATEDPTVNDLYSFGTAAKILQVLRLPNNLLKVLVEGVVQAEIIAPTRKKDCLEVKIAPVAQIFDESDTDLQAKIRKASELFTRYVKESDDLPPEIIPAFENINDPLRKLYYAAANIKQKVETKQKILNKTAIAEQYFELIYLLSSELEMFKIEDELDEKVQESIHRTQRKYFIQEQIRALQKELDDDDDEANPELAALKQAIDNSGMHESALTKAMEEFEKLKKTPPMSPEYSVIRTYLETLTALPWAVKSEDNMSVAHVRQILDEDHYDLEKPKERILEYISVLNLVGSLRGQILCFVGPPGVGKTSLGRSIARALNRKFTRISLGGVRDEAEIRGHRRTYIGALPGKIIQSMKKAGTINPVILLDEVDKMSMDFRGDPSSALLEVLDPEQNSTFNDHYLEVDYDLSHTLFITTANVKYDIPAPLLDRMEVIEISSYLEHDKAEIARHHLIPKALKENGLEAYNIKFDSAAVMKIIREYTREAGVRNLDRQIASVLRKIAKDIVLKRDEAAATDAKPAKKTKKQKPLIVNEETVEHLLKIAPFRPKADELDDKVGVARGLAWTSMGGDTLPVEVTIMPGAEKLTLTGKLGDVMKESATAALSYVRSRWYDLGVPEDFAKGKEIHIHVPEGAIPKDGPSAGITMTIALISAATGEPIRGDVAMTGEITLRGNILPIGGLNEKLLAAKRVGVTIVLIPSENQKDLSEISSVIKEGMSIVPVNHILDALPLALRTIATTKGVPQK
ncbi:MAG: endopeptidase La [Bacteroidetes bacterium]|nr:endopeptidase La [Bacteroidota bacterium]